MSNVRGAPVAVVTGAARGLGFEIVRLLSRRGYVVVAADIDAQTVRGAHDGDDQVRPVGLDVRDADACSSVAASAVREHGRLDVWINNAGILHTGPSWELGTEIARRTVEVNALGPVNGTLAALEQMRPQQRGSIVSVVSLAGLSPVPGMAAYSASKHAALAFSLATLGELRAAGERGIAISCLCPSGIWTPMLHDKTDDFWASASFGGRMLAPKQVAERAVALIDRPRPVACVPRFMGPVSRMIASTPRLTARLTPLVMRAAAAQRRRNARILQKS